MDFSVIFHYFKILFTVKSSGCDQMLTKIFHIDQKLTFNVFHILNQGRISKIEKISDSTDYRPPKKRPFFLGGGASGDSKTNDLGYVSDQNCFQFVTSDYKAFHYCRCREG